MKSLVLHTVWCYFFWRGCRGNLTLITLTVGVKGLPPLLSTFPKIHQNVGPLEVQLHLSQAQRPLQSAKLSVPCRGCCGNSQSIYSIYLFIHLFLLKWCKYTAERNVAVIDITFFFPEQSFEAQEDSDLFGFDNSFTLASLQYRWKPSRSEFIQL